MDALHSTAAPFQREPDNYDEASMQQSILFSDSLKDLKNLRKQLYTAAEYFELSYTNHDQKQIMVNSLKDYAVKALVNTVDHLGSVTYKVNDLLDEKVDEVTRTDLRVSCIEQRLRTCQEYIDREGNAQQSLNLEIPKYHKRYILPDGKATIKETRPPPVGKLRSPSPTPQSMQQRGKFLFSATMPKKDLEKRAVSPRRFPLLRSGSFSGRPTTPKPSRSTTPNHSRPTTPKLSRSTTPNHSRPTTQNSSFGKHQYLSQAQKSASMRYPERENPKDVEQITSKSKRLLRALLSRRKSKRDETLYTYLDEYT